MSPPSKCWDNRYVPRAQCDSELGIKRRALCELGKHANN